MTRDKKFARSGNDQPASPARWTTHCLIAFFLSIAPFAISQVSAEAQQSSPSFYDIFELLEAKSALTQRQLLGTHDASNSVLQALSRMQRRLPAVFGTAENDTENTRISNSNVTFIAQGQCHILAAGAGHSVLDPRYKTAVERKFLRVLLPSGNWVTPELVVTPFGLHKATLEHSDWALMVLPKLECDRETGHNWETATVRTEAVTPALLNACTSDVQLVCHHFDTNHQGNNGTRHFESGCSMIAQPINATGRHDSATFGHVGYFSCKQSRGVSGCAVLCDNNGELINLGIFNKGLRRAGDTARLQKVGAFRVIDGNLWSQISALKTRFNMHDAPLKASRHSASRSARHPSRDELSGAAE